MSESIVEEMSRAPAAYAGIKGTKKYPGIKGIVYFFDAYGGTILVAEIYRAGNWQDCRNSRTSR